MTRQPVMTFLIPCVFLFFPSLSFSSHPTHPRLSRPLITRPQNLSRRLQPGSAMDGDATNELYDRSGTNPWAQYNAHAHANPSPHYPSPEAPILRPEVTHFHDHGGDDFHSVDSYGGVEGGGGHDYHNDDFHRHPHKPLYVAVNTHDDHHDAISKLGFLAIVKLVLAKFKTFWLIKLGLFLIFFIKIPFVIFKIALKFLLVLKFAKLFKLLIIPSLIPLILLPLLPLLLLLVPLLLIPLAPLLFIPALLPLFIPLLLLLPIPIFAQHHSHPVFHHRPPQRPTPTERPDETDEEKAQRSWKGVSSIQSLEELVVLTRRVMDSQQCMEKLACDIGGSQTPSMMTSTITRLLEVFESIAPRTILARLRSYTKAFQLGAGQERKCASEFLCSPSPGLMANVEITL